MKKFNTYKACEKAVGLKSGLLPDVSMLPKEFQKSIIADFKYAVIAKAHNDDWEPDFTDYNQPKYFIWPDILADKKRPTGFGLSCYDYDFTASPASVGSRHLLKSRELCKHVFDTFPEILKDHYLLK